MRGFGCFPWVSGRVPYIPCPIFCVSVAVFLSTETSLYLAQNFQAGPDRIPRSKSNAECLRGSRIPGTQYLGPRYNRLPGTPGARMHPGPGDISPGMIRPAADNDPPGRPQVRIGKRPNADEFAVGSGIGPGPSQTVLLCLTFGNFDLARFFFGGGKGPSGS